MIEREKPILDVIISIQCLLVELGLAARTGRHLTLSDERVRQWAIAALNRAGYGSERIATGLGQLPPEKHWNYFQQRLPDGALRAFELKLLQQKEAREK